MNYVSPRRTILRAISAHARRGRTTPARTSRRFQVAGVAALSFTFGLAACDGGVPEQVTGLSSRPSLNAIPTENSSTLEVRIRNPDDGASVSGTVTIEVEVKDKDVDRERGELFIGDELVATSTSKRFSYSWSTDGYSGEQTITAVGWDVEGNSALAAITVQAPESTSDPEPEPDGPTVSSLLLDPDTVTAGDTATGTILLSGPAPAGGTEVTLASDDPAVATVPASVTVPETETAWSFSIESQPVASTAGATISASAGGTAETAVLWVLPAGITLDSIGVSPATLVGGEAAEGTVRLTEPAPDGGATVELSSSNPDVAAVPGTVTLPAGAASATFAVTTEAVLSETTVTLSGAFGGVTRSASLAVTPPPSGEGQLESLTITPDIVVGGDPAQGTVTLAAAVDLDTEVLLSTTDATVATVPTSVTVAAGATSATFTVTTLPNDTDEGQFAVIAGEAGGVSRSTSITTTPPPSGPAISSVRSVPSTFGGGGLATGFVTFEAPLDDGVILELTSSHPEILQVPDKGVQVVWSSTERAFPITTSAVSDNTVVTITAIACCGGVGEGTASVTVTTDAPPPHDRVEVKDARWTPGGRGGTLEVRADGSSSTAILTVFRAGTDIKLLVLRHVGGGRYEGEQSFGGGATNPELIDVRSNLGGTTTAEVRD